MFQHILRHIGGLQPDGHDQHLMAVCAVRHRNGTGPQQGQHDDLVDAGGEVLTQP